MSDLHHPRPHPRHAQHGLGLAAVAIAVVAWGTTGVITKSIDLDPLPIAFWRFLGYAAALTVVTGARGRWMTVTTLKATAPAGLLLSADVVGFYTAVKVTTIANATTIGALQPIVIAFVATRWFGERVRARDAFAAAVAISATVTVVAISSGTPQWSGSGDLAAVFATLAWSAYFIVARRTRRSLSTIDFTIGTAWWVAAAIVPLTLIVGQPLTVPPRSEWLALATLTFAGGLLGHSFMNWGLPRVPLWLSSTMTLLSPIVASVMAWVVLDERLTAVQIAAMLVVVAALTVIVTDGSASTTPAGERGGAVSKAAEPAR